MSNKLSDEAIMRGAPAVICLRQQIISQRGRVHHNNLNQINLHEEGNPNISHQSPWSTCTCDLRNTLQVCSLTFLTPHAAWTHLSTGLGSLCVSLIPQNADVSLESDTLNCSCASMHEILSLSFSLPLLLMFSPEFPINPF